MTEGEITILKKIIDVITLRRNNAEMKELTASHTDEAHLYGAEAWTLTQVLNDIHAILHNSIADEYQERMEKDIASMEQGYGGE
jgi:hypothetical protein